MSKSSTFPRAFRSLRNPLTATAFALALAACTGGGVTSTPTPPKRTSATTPVREPVRSAPREARVQVMPGLEGVIGANQTQLTRLFGKPRLEVWEGDARKLQYSGNACVLDIFLYPNAASRELHATYVDARRASDGQDVDRAACVAALKSR